MLNLLINILIFIMVGIIMVIVIARDYNRFEEIDEQQLQNIIIKYTNEKKLK